jgi:uncharacterized protein YndB with AHSA1/START domain
LHFDTVRVDSVKCNRYVAHMETTRTRSEQAHPTRSHDARPHHPEQGTSVERTAVLPASVDRVMAALSDPELLASWLGTCSEDGTRVRTDDGVVRRITERERDGDSILRWTWAPEAHPDDRSEVVVTLTSVGEQTRLVVRETRSPSTATAQASARRTAVLAGAADRWTGCLLALGAVLLAHAERAATV